MRDPTVLTYTETLVIIRFAYAGTEFVMMAFLTYLVCLKTASMNFTMNYRLPSFSIPIFCGGGCCSTVPKSMSEEEFIELVDSQTESSSKPLKKQSSFLAKIMRQKRQEKKNNAIQEQNHISSFRKPNKRKKDFGKVRKNQVEMKDVKTKATIADIYNHDEADQEMGSWGFANPLGE